MKKNEFVKKISDKTELTQKQVEAVLDGMVEVIVTETIENNEDINLPGLGKFRRKVNSAREGINPLTKQPLSIPESHTVKFTVTSSIKKVIQPKQKKGKK